MKLDISDEYFMLFRQHEDCFICSWNEVTNDKVKLQAFLVCLNKMLVRTGFDFAVSN